MDHEEVIALMGELVSPGYARQGQQSLQTRAKRVGDLLSHGRLPENGWSEPDIEMLLRELSAMDSSAFPNRAGVGEREGRIASPMVARRHWGLAHGIGRSGYISAIQPKAAGSSLINKLTNILAKDALRICGMRRLPHCLVLPVATGMSLSLCLSLLRAERPAARTVVWPRIDQKSCFKASPAAGMAVSVVQTRLEGDEVRVSAADVEAAVLQAGPDAVLCVMSTTSCFAPRGFDRVVELAQLCARLGVPHVINNAYGVQSSKLCHVINEATRVGRVDFVVQSTDKNFMVPVGGAIVASPSETRIDALAQFYPGRASMAPLLDLFITLLGWGANGLRRMLKQRKDLYPYFKSELQRVAARHGERVLETPHNPISLAVTLDHLGGVGTSPSFFGSMLFSRWVSGARVVVRGATKEIEGVQFRGWGAQHDDYPHHYFTAACSIGLDKEEADLFFKRLDKTMTEFAKKCARDRRKRSAGGPQQEAGAAAAAGGGAGGDEEAGRGDAGDEEAGRGDAGGEEAGGVDGDEEAGRVDGDEEAGRVDGDEEKAGHD